ncbi:MAG: MFS transporter [Actinobacteria bacterium]|nr:MFS transporter [Actinomycetota bacterium]
MSRYFRILRRRAALLPFAAAVVARLPIAMGPLGVVLLVQSVRDSYSVAGIVTAAWALASSVATPLLGRGLDRFGQPLVIGITSVASGTLLAVFALSAVNGASDAVLLVLSAGVGLTFPPVGPAMRAAWRVVLTDDADRRAAYALDAVAVETIFVGGPLLLSLLLVVAPPVVPLLVTAVLLAGGGAAYAFTAAARAVRPEEHHDGAGHRSASPLRSRGVLAVVLVTTGLAVGFGQCDVSIAATAREVLGSQAKVGLLFTFIAGGSAIGGLWYGARVWRRPERTRYPFTLAGFASGLGLMALLILTLDVPPLVAVLPVMFVTGVCIAPGLIIAQNLVDHLAPRDRLSEAQAWLNTAFTTGGAAGTAIGGLLVDVGGPGVSFLGACAAVGCAALAAALVQPRWRTASEHLPHGQAPAAPVATRADEDAA